MGAQFCSEGRNGGANVVLDIINPMEAEPSDTHFHKLRCNSGEQHAFEVAKMIAADRRLRGFESASLIPALFDVHAPAMQDPPNTYIATHRTTGMTRRLITIQKPGGAEQQERLRSVVRQLQALQSDSIARIFEVFEDWRATSLVMEHCSGGTMYDRILQRQYFAEQETAVLIRHVLQSLAFLHRNGLSHGFPTPDSFRFQSETPHASLKLVDFGLDLKVHLWDALRALGGGARERRRTMCLHFFETCSIVFSAPEVTKPFHESGGRAAENCPKQGNRSCEGQLDCDLLAEVIDTHLEREEVLDARRLEAADAWSVGAITFLLLCGYPPFFAPCRHAILSRIDGTDYAFDPPFWSKISEEAKDFVQQCLQGPMENRMSVTEALRHPWITGLADTSPSGSMLPSFALNLRRFFRTSLIEAFTANSLASKLSFHELQALADRCREVDVNASGFFTASDLRQVLVELAHNEIAEAVAMCFSRTLRHPGESYIDYVALIESVRARRERLLEEELWASLCEFSRLGNQSDTAELGRMPLTQLDAFLQAPHVQRALGREGIEDCSAMAEAVHHAVRPSRGDCDDLAPSAGVLEVDFIEVASEVIQHMPTVSHGPLAVI